MFNDWQLHDDTYIALLTPDELNKLDDGTKVISIFGVEKFQSKEKPLDTDTRFGYTAFGFPRSKDYVPSPVLAMSLQPVEDVE